MVTQEDNELVEKLLISFSPQLLRLAVLFISFDSSTSDLIKYLSSHQEYKPNQRELLKKIIRINETEVQELEMLSKSIVLKGYDLDEIIPLDGVNGERV